MNSKENSSNTTEIAEDSPRRKRKVPNEKIVELLKLVYFERTSIRQASKHLKINYSSAKKIIDQFRKNKLPIEGNYGKDFDDILWNINFNRSSNSKTFNDRDNAEKECDSLGNLSRQQVNPEIMDSATKKAYEQLAKEIKAMYTRLVGLRNEILDNQQKIRMLLGYTVTK